ncbi:OTU domain-containing protein 7B-like [Littorina saxatilis]
MPTFDEREHLVKEFCKNTGATDKLARDVLNRNKWNLPSSYKEVEQMCVSSYRNSANYTSPPPYPSNDPVPLGPTSRGGTEGGVGPAVTLDTRGIRPNPQGQQGQGLTVALPPVAASVERVIPIEIEGGTMMYHPKSSAPATAGMARVTQDEKVVPCQPGMVPPKMSSSSSIGKIHSSDDPVPQTKPTSESVPRLRRGFSNIMENEPLVNAARSSVLQDIAEDNHYQMFSTFVLPDLTAYGEDFQAFLKKELIESSTLHSLQAAGRLNWWAELGLCQRLIPMATSGDGNCLLHAASLAMWGIHDRLLTLRNALHDTLTKAPYKDNLYRRWRWQQTLVNQQADLVFSEAEWKQEWENILRLASPSPRSGPDHSTNINSCCDSAITSSSSGVDPVVYESLEEFHVFVLAHVLKRPIIVVADTILRDANGDALAPIPFGGIYLPLECNSGDCCFSPLLLTYDAAHFSALVPMQHSDSSQDSFVPLAIPVVDPQLKLLPLHFCHDPDLKFDWSTMNNKDIAAAEPCLEDRLNLLKAYMNVISIPLSTEAPLINDTRYTSRQSSAGSTGSEDSGGFGSGSLRDKKKEGKQNSVAKQFGSLGKSVGKKLKNLGNNLAPSKTGSKAGVDGVSGGLNQSTKVITALATMGSEEVVYCAKLSCGPLGSREVFIKNYLKDAEKRFHKDQELKRLRADQPPQARVGQYSPMMPRGRSCRTPSCPYFPLPDLSLCDRCASNQQWQQAGTLDRGKGQGQQLGYNTFPGRYKANTGLPPSAGTSDEIYKFGKSKFYTPHPDPPLCPTTCRYCDKPTDSSHYQRGMWGIPPPSPVPAPPPQIMTIHDRWHTNPTPNVSCLAVTFMAAERWETCALGATETDLTNRSWPNPRKLHGCDCIMLGLRS